MRIVFLDEGTLTLGDVDFAPLEALGDYVSYAGSTADEATERAAGAEIVIVNKVPVTVELLNGLDRLRMVSVVATGYNNVDLAAARRKGVRVCNVSGYAGFSVTQHTFALILNLVTKACVYHQDIVAGDWARAGSFNLLTYGTFELAGKRIGIIGFGAIGRRVARVAEAFGMTVLVNDIAPVADSERENTDLDTLLRESDVVTIHCPLTERTRGLIGRAELRKMKPTAILINTARGGIVDEDALAESLNAGRLAGAGVDVLSEEPPRDNPLLNDVRNIILTPHSAWSTREARQRLIDETAENIKAFLTGEERNIVA